MGIALYGMFIAIIIPPARKSKKVVVVIVVSVAITCILRYVPRLSMISSGFRVIIATVLAAGICAKLYPMEEGGTA
jgi:predicted branched-subunit amino acid permease